MFGLEIEHAQAGFDETESEEGDYLFSKGGVLVGELFVHCFVGLSTSEVESRGDFVFLSQWCFSHGNVGEEMELTTPREICTGVSTGETYLLWTDGGAVYEHFVVGEDWKDLVSVQVRRDAAGYVQSWSMVCSCVDSFSGVVLNGSRMEYSWASKLCACGQISGER